MPQAAVAIAGALMKIGIPKLIAGAIGSFVVRLAVSTVVNAVIGALTPKPKAMQQGVQLQTKVDPAYPREVAVGVFATGGSLAFENVEGEENRYLWRVIILSDAEIQEITQVRGGGETLTFDGDIHTGFRGCTSHYQSAGGVDCLKLRIYKGTQDQAAPSDLVAAFPSMVNSNFRLRGMAYAVVRLQYSADAFPGGVELVFVGKGALIEDPRTGTTAFTENAALIGRAFVKGFENNGVRVVGLGCDEDADFNEAEFAAAADECDETVSLAAGGTEARYRAGGMINSRENAREVLSEIAAAMAGKHIDTGGQITLQPGVARTPLLDVEEDDLLADEPFVYVARRTSDERANAIASTFVNPDEGFQESPLPPRKDAARIAADGARYEMGRAYRFVYSKTQGQRLDAIELARAGYEGFVAFSGPLWMFELAPGDWFTMTNRRWGGVEKTWEVETIRMAITKQGESAQARCAITAREVGADAYEWSTSDEITVASATLTIPPPLSPPVVVGPDEPTNPTETDLWTDTTFDPPLVKQFIDNQWKTVSAGAASGTGGTTYEDTNTDFDTNGTTVTEAVRITIPSAAIGSYAYITVELAGQSTTTITSGVSFDGTVEVRTGAEGAANTDGTQLHISDMLGSGVTPDMEVSATDELAGEYFDLGVAGVANRDVWVNIARDTGSNNLESAYVYLKVTYFAPA